MYKNIKSLLDFIVALILFFPFIIIFIIIGICIKLEDKGPVIYAGERIGKNGKIFKMYKFRSMKVNAPDLRLKDGTTYNSKNDPRVTRVGKFIRETSIDELPQILNILKGEMSFIGPRASLATAIDKYKDDEKDKLLVKPGITGYTQAYYRNNISSREKRLKDVWYANNFSFWLDVKIFFKTISTVFKREGLYTKSSEDNLHGKSSNKM